MLILFNCYILKIVSPYNEILHTLPHYCMVDEPLWMACVPMFCLEIVKVHSPDRVMRQFGHSQHVPVIVGEPTTMCMISVGGRPALEVDVSSGFVHSADTSIAMSRGLFKLYSLALQWQRDTTSVSHGEEVSQIVKDTLVEAEIQFREPFFEGDPLFEHVRARGPRRGRMGHKSRARGRALGRGAGGMSIPPDIEAETDSRCGRIGRMSYDSTIDVGDYIPDMMGTLVTVHCDNEDTTIYNTLNFIEGLLDDPIESQITLSPLSSSDVTFNMPVDDML
uniref:Aminotransferase-like plant mobile domain-containing protein n=1 Tax=Solanum lycopersicum TaxID=4081 RepID=K4C4E4_SOLLC